MTIVSASAPHRRLRCVFRLAAMLLVGGMAGIAAADRPATADGRMWPGFRGLGTSLTSAADLPLVWNDASGVRWTAELPGYGQSSPVVWGNRVFVTTIQGENKETPTVLCLALDLGQPLWQRVFTASQTTPVSNYVSRSAPTPVVDKDRVYAFFESGDLFVLDHDGNALWSRSLVEEYGPIQGHHGIGSSPALAEESVVVLMNHGGPSYLLALDKQTGNVRWKADYGERVAWSSPVVCRHDGRELVLTSAAGVVEAYDATQGRRLWRIDKVSGNTVPSPTVHGERVILGSTDKSSNLAIQLPPGASSDPPAVLWKADGPSCSFASPLVHQGHVYYVNAAGVAFCVHLETGRTLWTQRLGDSCWASPLGAGDHVYFFTKSGVTIVAKTGTEWEELARNELEVPPGAKLYGAAAVDGAILIRTGSRIVCVAGT